jgi:hypothetical protein
MKKDMSFKKLVLGNAGKKKVRRKKGAWDVMYGGAESPEKKKKRKDGNFWVDTKDWF